MCKTSRIIDLKPQNHCDPIVIVKKAIKQTTFFRTLKIDCRTFNLLHFTASYFYPDIKNDFYWIMKSNKLDQGPSSHKANPKSLTCQPKCCKYLWPDERHEVEPIEKWGNPFKLVSEWPLLVSLIRQMQKKHTEKKIQNKKINAKDDV